MNEEISYFDANEAERVQPVVRIHHRIMTNCEGSFAMDLVRIGMDARVDHGRGSSLLTPDELVERACDIAAKTYVAMRERGWLIDVPSRDDLLEAIRAGNGTKPAAGFTATPFQPSRSTAASI